MHEHVCMNKKRLFHSFFIWNFCVQRRLLDKRESKKHFFKYLNTTLNPVISQPHPHCHHCHTVYNVWGQRSNMSQFFFLHLLFVFIIELVSMQHTDRRKQWGLHSHTEVYCSGIMRVLGKKSWPLQNTVKLKNGKGHAVLRPLSYGILEQSL